MKSSHIFIEKYFNEMYRIAKKIDKISCDKVVEILYRLRINHGRLFILGVGGSAASASHAVNDFRKLCNIESYTPSDNVSELTARINDEGWDTCLSTWLKGSNLSNNDVVMVLSVGGGSKKRKISTNIIQALQFAKLAKALTIGIVGRDGGYTKKNSDVCILIPVVNDGRITPHTESFHSVIVHMLVSHPKLKIVSAKWESVK